AFMRRTRSSVSSRSRSPRSVVAASVVRPDSSARSAARREESSSTVDMPFMRKVGAFGEQSGAVERVADRADDGAAGGGERVLERGAEARVLGEAAVQRDVAGAGGGGGCREQTDRLVGDAPRHGVSCGCGVEHEGCERGEAPGRLGGG